MYENFSDEVHLGEALVKRIEQKEFVRKAFEKEAKMADGQRWQKEGGADQNFDYMFKLLIIGNSSVGKTSFLFRYADDSFTSAFVSTVGIDFKVKTVFRGDKRVKLQVMTPFVSTVSHCRNRRE